MQESKHEDEQSLAQEEHPVLLLEPMQDEEQIEEQELPVHADGSLSFSQEVKKEVPIDAATKMGNVALTAFLKKALRVWSSSSLINLSITL